MFVPKIGLEIHIHLTTSRKLFCGCKNDPLAPPNTHICDICTGQPGSLPVLNREAVTYALKMAQALKMEINSVLVFDRKHYFYHDLPKNFQITQYFHPLGINGIYEIGEKMIRIKEMHLEEDAARTIYTMEYRLVDFNRSGAPLIEIVTQPDFINAGEVVQFIRELQAIARYLKISDASMEKGFLRVDVNISVSRDGEEGERVEVKNLNSLKSIRRAIEYEIGRHIEIMESGGKVKRETRTWNENRDVTEPLREKEIEKDYRYFPEPNIPPFGLEGEKIEIPELPGEKRKRYRKRYRWMSEKEIEDIVLIPERAYLFERLAGDGGSRERVRKAYDFVLNLIKGREEKFTPAEFQRIFEEYLNENITKYAVEEILSSTGDIETLLAEAKDKKERMEEKTAMA